MPPSPLKSKPTSASILRNILIFHAGALGDFVLSWPLALALSRVYPTSRVFYVCAASKGELAARALGVEWADSESDFPKLFAPGCTLPDQSKALRLLSAAHTVISFASEPTSAWNNNVQSLNPQALLLFARTKPPDSSQHATDFLLSQFSSQPVIYHALKQTLLNLGTAGLFSSPASPAAPVLLHPGSGSPTKCWPLEHWIKLATLLQQTGQAVQFVLGEVELERLTPTNIAQLQSTAPCQTPKTYLDLFHLLKSARLFIGNDTGPSHLAGIMGLPTLVLFGPTSPAVWQPIGPSVKVFASENLASIQPQHLIQSLSL